MSLPSEGIADTEVASSDRRYESIPPEDEEPEVCPIDSVDQWLHNKGSEGDDKRSPLLRWLQDNEDPDAASRPACHL